MGSPEGLSESWAEVVTDLVILRAFVPMMTAVSAWLPNNRSIAVSLVSAGVGVAPMTVSPLVALLLQNNDWRTAQFTIPAENGPLDQDFVALWKQNYPEWRRRARHSLAGFPYTASVTQAFEVSAAERAELQRASWQLRRRWRIASVRWWWRP